MDAEDGDDFCYWHQDIKGKKPTLEQLNELKNMAIHFVFLQGANLIDANLQSAHLMNANLYNAELLVTNLQNANLSEANLQDANLSGANLQNANLSEANLQNANLSGAKLRNAELLAANLQNANLSEANLQDADLFEANLQDADLFEANLQKAELLRANLQKANLNGANLEKANLEMASLQKVYLRRANLKDTNLIGADLNGADMLESLFNSNTSLQGANLLNANLYLSFIDETKTLRYAQLFNEEKLSEKEINEQKGDSATERDDKYRYYQKSFEVYKKLYHFYSGQNMDFRASHAYYRSEDVRRKLLTVRNKWNSAVGISERIRSWGFNWFVLKQLTGYGEATMRPAYISIFWVCSFAIIYYFINGIVVEGRNVRLMDYFYLSLTTFTGLGFSNVQPNITVSLMQPLIMTESTFGILMIGLIVYLLTNQLSRR
ncbi:pentapeptide repeat-containing protein [Methanolobus vulcani]|uniref:pentapeptide repeat-containing protein n=1 Tax=Methanolobus vulcani TaxID=38026 RepID=UPI0018ACCE1C|nr:pentapeptide repeat-containing protein [Methanolobus vulcani]